tara:strand:+ start:1748 stop:1951 length:204 start_codon:yes stop_codon:yes gene_type:complete
MKVNKEKQVAEINPVYRVEYYNEMVKFAQIVTKTNTRTVLPAIDILGGHEFRRRFKTYYNGKNINKD